MNLVVFKIKDTDFDYTKYGLEDVYFSIDITNNLNSSKAVKTTQYPLLDGTTRVDTVSRAPGTLNFQGKIGEVYNKANDPKSVKDQGDKTRLEMTIELLEDLRDQAIFLDVITHVKTYYDYRINSVNVGLAQFGVSDLNMQLSETLMFGEEIEVIMDERENAGNPDAPETSLENFEINQVTTELGFIDEMHRIIKNSELSVPYIVHFGPIDSQPDVTVNPLEISEPTMTRQNDQEGLIFTYYPPKFTKRKSGQILISGYVRDNYKIEIDIPQVLKEYLTIQDYYEDISESRDQSHIPEFSETSRWNIGIKLKKKTDGEDETVYSTNNGDILITPKYSNVTNGMNPISSSNTLVNDLIVNTGRIDAVKSSMSFIRKCRNNTYRAVPNLLRDINLGYLYPTFHLKKKTSNASDGYYLNIGFVYIHPDAAKKIKDAISLEQVRNGSLLRSKTIVWW